MGREDLHGAFNSHLQRELYAAYLYLSMAAYFEDANLPGFTAWMKMQAKEEFEHAMKFWGHLYDRGSRVTLLAIEKPPANWTSPLDAVQDALEHERQVTRQIHDLYGRAKDEKDYAAEAFLQSFVVEQVEEERSAASIVDTLKKVGDSPASLLLLDREMGTRGTAA